MPQQLPDRKHQPLRRRIHRHISRLLDDVEALKMHPHWVGGIRDSSMRESVCREQVAELIVPSRLRDSEDRDECDSNGQNYDPHGKYRKLPPPCQPAECAQQRLKCDDRAVFCLDECERQIKRAAPIIKTASIIAISAGASRT